MLESKATSALAITIRHPAEECDDIKFTIPFFRKQPIACVQDSKHLLKTFRNNLYSGARLLTFPDSVAHYGQVRAIAFSGDSPLFRRDVEKVDRQDDNAATRLFSANVLEWLKARNPDHLALIVYLFVFGELIDAYQNRFYDIHHYSCSDGFASQVLLGYMGPISQEGRVSQGETLRLPSMC